MNNIVLLLAVLLLCTSCGDQNSVVVTDGYEEEFRLKDDTAQELFIERLKTSDFDYKVVENGAIRYHAKDREELHRLAFDSAQELRPDETETNPAWRVSKKEAENIVSAEYPDILTAARMVGPMAAKVTSGINGFANPGEEVWHIRIICQNGGTKALFFVHPVSGGLYEIQSPNAAESTKCE